MAKKYLNKNTKFQCKNGNAVWFKPQNGDFKVKINGAEALLDDCILNIIGGPRPGQCNLVPDPTTGAPGVCSSAILSGSWSNKSKVAVGNKNVLISDCSVSCPVGGSIVPFNPTLLSLNVMDGADTKTINIASLSSTCEESSSSEEALSNNNTRNDTNSIDPVNSSNKNSNNTENDNHNEQEENIENVEYAFCDYKNCSKSKDCKYLKTSHNLVEEDESKNARILKINMGKDSFDLYAGDCSEIATSLYGNYMYSIAHHHIIPANQCFKQFPEIVKLANFYNYDINKAENGICLPTMNEGYDKQPIELRKNIAFTAMRKLGKEWHKGGHKYSCKISVDLDSVLPRPFVHYKDAVDKELTTFSILLNDDIKCRAENYEEQAAKFIKSMDHICERIVKKLRRFEDNPQKAYPCYISKLAFYYAYQDELNEYENEMF